MKSFGKNESSTSSHLQILYHQTSVVKNLSGGNTKFTFVSVNSDIGKYFISVTFISVVEIVPEIVAKLEKKSQDAGKMWFIDCRTTLISEC